MKQAIFIATLFFMLAQSPYLIAEVESEIIEKLEFKLEGTVIAKNKLTFAIGGLVRQRLSQTENRVPGLADIPIIGKPFSSKKKPRPTQ